uniref:Uncharacterized protein n=1 Tax=Megaselia scalaris TaxID=36166 RepID=T1GTY2_MEGSC
MSWLFVCWYWLYHCGKGQFMRHFSKDCPQENKNELLRLLLIAAANYQKVIINTTGNHSLKGKTTPPLQTKFPPASLPPKGQNILLSRDTILYRSSLLCSLKNNSLSNRRCFCGLRSLQSRRKHFRRMYCMGANFLIRYNRKEFAIKVPNFFIQIRNLAPGANVRCNNGHCTGADF